MHVTIEDIPNTYRYQGHYFCSKCRTMLGFPYLMGAGATHISLFRQINPLPLINLHGIWHWTDNNTLEQVDLDKHVCEAKQ